MIPFLVADRPISLSIIKGISLPATAKIGILTQAITTTDRFKDMFRCYPYGVDVMYPNGQPTDDAIKARTVKLVDSGIFGKNGCNLGYAELFKEYEKMGADYGVVIDVMRDKDATLTNARAAMREYSKCKRSFKLVGVAQGRTTTEYYRCFEQLSKMGFEHIAVGGLLQKRENTARYVQVRCTSLLRRVLKGIRKRFEPEWLFALGVFHPDRLDLFEEVGLWGSDYNGWIFNYEKRDTVLSLIRSRRLSAACRVAIKDLRVADVKKLGEQKLRFFLTRGCIERRVMDRLHGRRLLILACSSRKCPGKGAREAWNLYDGVAYRMLKKLEREHHFPSDVDVLILSAEHGLVARKTRLAHYDRKMTPSRAEELSKTVSAELKSFMDTDRHSEVFLCMGKDYLGALEPMSNWHSGDITVQIARGRIGEKLRELKAWLRH